uniref:KH domain-containing protein n=1 Tax=Steinernema glaseri TaxID=37863 RepID=A0A1I8A9B2_9BILA
MDSVVQMNAETRVDVYLTETLRRLHKRSASRRPPGFNAPGGPNQVDHDFKRKLDSTHPVPVDRTKWTMTSNERIDEVDNMLSTMALSASGDATVHAEDDAPPTESVVVRETAPNSEADLRVGVSMGPSGDVLSTALTSPQNSRPSKTIKIPIPTEPPNFKYIGRLLGPRGSSIRELEQVTKCRIVIKGRGSMRDPAKEEAYRNRPGYEHLSEELHVRVTPVDSEDAPENLAMARQIVESLLVATDDVYKQRQLVQLSLMNGTYRPEYSILKQDVSKLERSQD